MDHLGLLAELAAETTPPAAVRAKAALILTDTIGAIVGGAAEAEVSALTDRLKGNCQGQALVIGRGDLTAPQSAAFLNGTAGTALEMDEGHQFCKGHPGIHVIPAALAAASTGSYTGKDLLTAITIGYEAAARVGIATALRPSMHPHGTWGAIGAATGVLRLQGTSAAQHRDAMNMAANLGLTTSRRTMLEGGTVRNVFAGVSNQMGLLVADLVAAGFSGDRDGVAQVFGHVAADAFDHDQLTHALGDRWEVDRNYFKMHSCCRFNHATLDALASLTADTPGLRPEAIEEIVVETYGLAVELDDPAPRNVLAAKFSVPFAVATRLVTGSSAVESFAAERVSDEAIRSLAARVTLLEDPAMTAKLPDKRPARLTVTLKDGGTLHAMTETNRGDWSDPFPESELHAKFLSLTARLWSSDKAEAVWEAGLGLDGSPDCTGFLQLLAAPG